MISRTTIGRSFAGLVRYQFEGRKELPSDKQAEVLTAVGVRADSAAHMSMDFQRGRQLNPNLGQAVWHTSLSFNPDDAARLDSPKMLAIAESYVQKMGLDKTQYAIIRHHDQPDNQHLHIIANRVGNDGQTIKDGQNFYRSKQALVELIQEHGLTPPKGLRPEKQHPAQLHGADLAKHDIREALRTVLVTAADSKALREGLQKRAVTFQVFRTKEGKPAGISFEKDGQTFKGSEVHRSYSIAGIGKQLVANQATQQAAQARKAAELQAAQARQEATRRAAAAEAERQAAERRVVAQGPKVPELPAVERKWQSEYQQYLAGIAQRNAPVQARNKVVDSYSNHLRAHPTEEGVKQVLQAMKTDPHMATLKAELERQLAARAHHADQWARSYGQQAELEQQAKGNFLGYKNAAAKEAAEKLEFLRDKARPLPGLLAPNVLAFARAAKAADQAAPAVGFEARTYHQPEQVGLSLAVYAAKREAERQLVVRVSEPASEIKTTGRAEILRNTLTSKGVSVAMSHTVDAQGNRVSEVVVQYSLQQSRSEVKDISIVLDWAAKQQGHELKESDADRTQRQGPGQRDASAQQEQARTREKGHGLGFGNR